MDTIGNKIHRMEEGRRKDCKHYFNECKFASQAKLIYAEARKIKPT